jgi:hypothetical protein
VKENSSCCHDGERERAKPRQSTAGLSEAPEDSTTFALSTPTPYLCSALDVGVTLRSFRRRNLVTLSQDLSALVSQLAVTAITFKRDSGHSAARTQRLGSSTRRARESDAAPADKMKGEQNGSSI